MGEITSYIDVAQLTLYAFYIFFAGLVLYLRREDKREGYPLLSDRSGRVRVQGFPAIPSPKSFWMPEGHMSYAPETTTDIPRGGYRPAAPWPGAPMTPTGNPLLDGVGPAAWANRVDEPELTWEGEPAIVPLSIVDGTFVEPRDVNPIGMRVYGMDGREAGIVREIWTDRSEPQIRYLEVTVDTPAGTPRNVLLPMGFAVIDKRRGWVTTNTILASQFADVPELKSDRQITKLEEDKVTAYFAGGLLYATPGRLEPVI
ncbi:photosynthetic reaction center subunit H [uncultured Enterovirga sp.]|uniref:photosynthetic reaction center subunit H n=1 Tax=uncultured Enterovirga sp. TaxID=2026352 RepID=UPI0035C9EF52